jgi:hypothetical protein
LLTWWARISIYLNLKPIVCHILYSPHSFSQTIFFYYIHCM